MKTAILALSLVFGISMNTYADAAKFFHFRLVPTQSHHRFPFFDTPTSVWAYNETVPGPTIRAKQGSIIEIDLFNKLEEPTSVHGHGLRIDNAMDGVPGVTQDPVAPGAG